MESERSLLGGRSVPRYTFLGGGDPPQKKFRRFRCCLCTVLTILVTVSLVAVLSLYLNPGETTSRNSRELDDLLKLQWPLREERYTDLQGDVKNELEALRVGVEGLREKDAIEESQPLLRMDSPAFRHHLATHTTPQAQKMSRRGYIINMASRQINKYYSNGTTWKKPRRWIWNERSEWYPHEEYCRNDKIKCTMSLYRTANGTCNNLKNPTWGAALQPFRRILLPRYEDGVSEPRRASDGNQLPSAREVSLAVHKPRQESDVRFTVMLAVWGQFIDHDITATAISKGKNGSAIQCCQNERPHPECFPVVSTQFPENITCMEFVRSAPAPTCTFGPREQLNQVTSFLDGSVMYGSDDIVMNQLRTFVKGGLKMLSTPAGDLLPVSEDLNDGCNREEEFERGRYCFSSGDKRSNENLLLTSMHLLFARYHNLLAMNLAEVNPQWSDEKLFQESRRIVAAVIQHITYNEFLPVVLPEALMLRLNISSGRLEKTDSYNSSVNPTIANVFASAAFRFGHTLLPGLLHYWRSNSSREEFLELHKMLFNPFEAFEAGFLESFMRGALNSSSEKSDVFFTREVTQKLFKNKTKGSCGLDLVSLNIQRGRDHGLPSYPHWRAACGLEIPRNFDDLKYDIAEETLKELKNLYRSVEDVDVYTGGLAESPVAGGLVGPTITCLLADQFFRLKTGDRFWYERTEGNQRFKPEQLREVRKSSLAKIICATSGVARAQPYVMRKAGIGNESKFCHEFSYLDLQAWKEA